MQYFHPKRPVKSFQDLEVYQKTFNLAVEIVKRLPKDLSQATVPEISRQITQNLIKTTLQIPKLLASAHSLRFGKPQTAIDHLEKAMLLCNLAVVYLEEFRDLVNQTIEAEYFEEKIKEYFRVRGQIFRLQKAWLKFSGERKYGS